MLVLESRKGHIRLVKSLKKLWPFSVDVFWKIQLGEVKSFIFSSSDCRPTSNWICSTRYGELRTNLSSLAHRQKTSFTFWRFFVFTHNYFLQEKFENCIWNVRHFFVINKNHFHIIFYTNTRNEKGSKITRNRNNNENIILCIN